LVMSNKSVLDVYIDEIERGLKEISNSAESYVAMKLLEYNIKQLEAMGIDVSEIEGIDAYYNLFPYFPEIESVNTSNDEDNAYIKITFDRAIKKETAETADFTVLKDGEEMDVAVLAEFVNTNDEITGVEISFKHGMDFDKTNTVKVVVGNSINYEQNVAVLRPFTFDNIVFSNNAELIDSMYNFYEGVGGFEIAGNLKKNYDSATGKMMIALYDDSETLVSAKIIENVGEVYEEFVLPEDVEMDQSWQLKAFIWSSFETMNPVQDVMNF